MNKAVAARKELKRLSTTMHAYTGRKPESIARLEKLIKEAQGSGWLATSWNILTDTHFPVLEREIRFEPIDDVPFSINVHYTLDGGRLAVLPDSIGYMQ